MEEPFNGWAVLELMGHRRLTGLVREVTLAGAGFLRIDVYEGQAEEAKATQFYPPSSVYCLTPTTEESARKAATPWQPPALTADPREQMMGDCGDEGDEEDECDYCLFCDSPCEGGYLNPKINLSPEAQKYFADRPHITLHVDPKGDVWEKSPDPFHPAAFVGCGEAVESVMCSPESVAKAGPRQAVWIQLDYWGNEVGVLRGGDPPG